MSPYYLLVDSRLTFASFGDEEFIDGEPQSGMPVPVFWWNRVEECLDWCAGGLGAVPGKDNPFLVHGGLVVEEELDDLGCCARPWVADDCVIGLVRGVTLLCE
jgi:hypothetical protein